MFIATSDENYMKNLKVFKELLLCRKISNNKKRILQFFWDETWELKKMPSKPLTMKKISEELNMKYVDLKRDLDYLLIKGVVLKFYVRAHDYRYCLELGCNWVRLKEYERSYQKKRRNDWI